MNKIVSRMHEVYSNLTPLETDNLVRCHRDEEIAAIDEEIAALQKMRAEADRNAREYLQWRKKNPSLRDRIWHLSESRPYSADAIRIARSFASVGAFPPELVDVAYGLTLHEITMISCHDYSFIMKDK